MSSDHSKMNSCALTALLLALVTASSADNALPTQATNAQTVELTALENHETGQTLDKLREAYDQSRSDGSNVWLKFADSCHVFLHRGGGEPNPSLASFDMDNTLIKPKSNKRYPKGADDWTLLTENTKTKLQQRLKKTRSRFVIFTNQFGVGAGFVPLEEVQQRIEGVVKALDVPCTVFVATKKDVFRKPQPGMFQLFARSFNGNVQVDHSKSYFCGDAVGHPSHSDADIKFAQRLELPFISPEDYLCDVKPKLVPQGRAFEPTGCGLFKHLSSILARRN